MSGYPFNSFRKSVDSMPHRKKCKTTGSIVVGVWIAKGTKLRERDFVIFAGFRGFRDPKAHEVQERQATSVKRAGGFFGVAKGGEMWYTMFSSQN